MPRNIDNTITIEEAIQRLKWEIIAQDWSLSIKRISLLEEAFLFLKEHYADRKPAHNILIMADSLLHYMKDRGDNLPSESIDFLKEAMAHIVNIHETEDLETEEEEHLFKILYYRFNKLKGKIKSHNKSEKDIPASSGAEIDPGKNDLEIETENDPFSPEKIELIKEKISSLQIEAEPEESNINHDMPSLISALHDTLEQAENLTARIKEIAGELQARDYSENYNQYTGKSSPIKNCPPTELRTIVIEGRSLYIQESAVARISSLSPAKISRIHDLKSIAVKDLASPFKRLPKQFKGILGSLSPGELKKIKLPVIAPCGPGLSGHPDTASHMAITISKGDLAGIILCSEVREETENMIKFQMIRDGDTIGIGYTDRGSSLRVINVAPVLKRDGVEIS